MKWTKKILWQYVQVYQKSGTIIGDLLGTQTWNIVYILYSQLVAISYNWKHIIFIFSFSSTLIYIYFSNLNFNYTVSFYIYILFHTLFSILLYSRSHINHIISCLYRVLKRKCCHLKLHIYICIYITYYLHSIFPIPPCTHSIPHCHRHRHSDSSFMLTQI